jgi:hypothetical protein
MRRKMVSKGTYRLKIPQARANVREPKSHERTSQRGKVFLSLKMRVATKSPALGVVATIILLRNAGLLHIWLNYT